MVAPRREALVKRRRSKATARRIHPEAREPQRYAPHLTGEGINVRRCRRPDVPAVLDLWAQARSEHASTPDRLDDVERLVAESPAALLVAEQNGEIVGALIAAWDGWRGNMYRLAVRDGQRREGIGLALTRAGEDYLRQCGVHRVTALVAFDDEVAGGFWESAGYPLDREIGRRVRNL
jgi:ribosomal protein S18 acetylase RimI-like enzyme